MRFKSAIKKFIYETFRPRSRADYAEVFSRGNGGGEGIPYPWLYSRALLLLFFLFSVLSLSFCLSGINFLAVAFAGGALADAVFIILLYELYPKRDFPFALPFAAFVLGGILSSAIAYLWYAVFTADSPYHMQAWTAFAEEFAKTVTVIIVILLIKNKNPYICIVLGAAVGGGFSAFENMWYAYTEGFAIYSVSKATQTLLIRSFGTPFSHAAWAGIFGWALSAQKPYKKWQTYAILAFNYIMHFFVNFPLMEQFGWKGYPISAFTGVASIILFIFLLVKSRNAFIVKDENSAQKIWVKYERLPKVNVAGEKDFSGFVFSKKLVTNAVGAAAAVLLSFALLGPALLFRGYTSFTYWDYDNFEDCRAVAQNGLEFNPDYGRDYKKLEDITQNWQVAYSAGELSYVVQRERSGEFTYRYRYSYRYYIPLPRKVQDDNLYYYVLFNGSYLKAYDRTEDKPLNGFEAVYKENSEAHVIESFRRMELQSVMVEYEGGIYYDTPVYDGGKTLHVFILNPKCFSVYITDSGKFRAVMDVKEPLGKTEATVFTAVFGCLAAGFGIAYLILKITSGRYKNVE